MREIDMNFFYKAYARTFQKILFVATAFLGYHEPKQSESVEDVPSFLKEIGAKKPLIVTGKTVAKSPIRAAVVEVLKKEGFEYAFFDGSKPDPDFECIEEGAKAFAMNHCDSLISVGGGSAMDCAKAILGRVAYPERKMEEFGKLLSIRKKLHPHIAIPTTAGTGSEATIAAVVTDAAHNHKFAIASPRIVPDYAILEPAFLEGLPQKTIAATGMDALTHALESYLGQSGTRMTKAYAVKAVQLIHANLLGFYADPKKKEPRANMLKASYLAGVSFTEAYVGYVHALAHALGGTFHVSHGYANAILLPIVLSAYGKSIWKKLAKLADSIQLTDANLTIEKKAKSFILWIESMNEKMGIPKSFGGIYAEKDIPAMVEHALKEANPFYPVPKLFGREELTKIMMEAM